MWSYSRNVVGTDNQTRHPTQHPALGPPVDIPPFVSAHGHPPAHRLPDAYTDQGADVRAFGGAHRVADVRAVDRGAFGRAERPPHGADGTHEATDAGNRPDAQAMCLSDNVGHTGAVVFANDAVAVVGANGGDTDNNRNLYLGVDHGLLRDLFGVVEMAKATKATKATTKARAKTCKERCS